MLEKLEQIEARYEALSEELYSPELVADQAAYGKAAKQHRSLGEMVKRYREWKSLKEQLAGAREMFDMNADDEEMRELARVEVETLQVQLERCEEDLRLLLLRPSERREERHPEFARARAAMKPRSLPPRCCACTDATPSVRAGAWKFWARPSQALAVTKKPPRSSKATKSIRS